MSESQLELFRSICFGYFLNLSPIKTQNQLIHALLPREVVPGVERELWIKINGTILSFGLGEFVVMISLKCVDDDATVYEKPAVNRLITEYFPKYGTNGITRQGLLNWFKKEWKSDHDAFKMTLMVFIHHFLFSHNNNSGISKANFNMIESGEYVNFT